MPPSAGSGARALRELAQHRALQLNRHIGVLRFDDEAGEAAILGDEVELVREAVRLPVERRVGRDADAITLAVEIDVARQRRRRLEVDRDVLEPEFLAAHRAQHQLQLRQPLVGEPEIGLGVDLRAGQTRQRTGSAAGDEDLGVGEPEVGAALDVKLLAGGQVVDRPGSVLSRSGQPRNRAAPSERSRCTDVGYAVIISILKMGLPRGTRGGRRRENSTTPFIGDSCRQR